MPTTTTERDEMRAYSAARGTFWKYFPVFYPVCAEFLRATDIDNLVKGNW